MTTSKDKDRELVFFVGYEGGGWEVFRKMGSDGKYTFIEHSAHMWIPEDDEEDEGEE